MTLSVETLLVVSLMMAVFAAISALGSSLFLGVGYERLRAGVDNLKSQAASFKDMIYQIDGRVDSVEKQSSYFFQAITDLETKVAEPPPVEEDTAQEQAEPEHILVAKDEVEDVGEVDFISQSNEGGWWGNLTAQSPCYH